MGIESNHPEALLSLAKLDLFENRLDLAEQKYLKLIELGIKKHADVYVGLATVASFRSNNQEALEYLNQAVQMDMKPSILCQRAGILMKLKQFEQALLDCDFGIQQDVNK